MSKLWKILNTPLVVVLIALSIWPILTVLSGGLAVKLGIQQIAEAVSEEVVEPFQNMSSEQDEKLKIEVGVLNKMTVSNIAFAPTSWTGKLKVIGTITNNSTHSVKGLHVSSSVYQNDILVNVTNDWLSNVKSISPNTSADFTFNIDVEEGQRKDNLKVKVNVSKLELLD